ncbi:hypothetical protein JTB14_007695 [Gonioctena quinquepunctata]|nr:hypothetical protein JTB14_007695 [Gonioctena quinquepunctata]
MRQLDSETVVIESKDKGQIDKVRSKLEQDKELSIKEMDNGDPRDLITVVEAGIKEEDFIQMLVTENDDIFGPDPELAKQSGKQRSEEIGDSLDDCEENKTPGSEKTSMETPEGTTMEEVEIIHELILKINESVGISRYVEGTSDNQHNFPQLGHTNEIPMGFRPNTPTINYPIEEPQTNDMDRTYASIATTTQINRTEEG